MPCKRYVVRGLVQGVFFRATTQATAQRLGLAGWVRNVPNGDVELIACGEQTKLEQLEKWLWQGPPGARVEHVECADAAPQNFVGFRVR